MKSLFKICLALSVMILIASCGKKNEVGKMIPSDAMFVAQVNFKTLDNKLSWDEIKQTGWYKKTYEDPAIPEWRKKILENPSGSGIDFDNPMTFFVAKNSGNNYFVAEGKIKDQKDFEQFNKNFDPNQAITKAGNINLIILKDKNIVGWNGDRFAYVMNPQTTSSEMYNWEDSATIQPNTTPADRSAELSELCQKLFSLKPDSSLAKNERFTDLLNQSADIRMWQNNEAIIKNGASMGMLSMMKLDAFTKDNVSTYAINFEKGKIDIDQRMYASKELTDVVKKYMGNSVNGDMINRIPSQNVFAVMAFNFKPEGLKEIIKLTGADGIINSYAQQMGFNLDDVTKATNGQWLLAFSDLKLIQDSSNFIDSVADDIDREMNKPNFNYLFSFGIGDKPSLQKLTDAANKMTSQMGKDSLIHYVMNDQTFVLSNSTSYANRYLASKNQKLDFTGKLTSHPIGLYFDLKKIFSEINTREVNDTVKKSILEQSIKMWENIISSGGEFKNNAFTFHTEINLINKDTNSLKQLNQYFDELYTLREAKRSERTRRLDSLLVPPPIDTVKVR